VVVYDASGHLFSLSFQHRVPVNPRSLFLFRGGIFLGDDAPEMIVLLFDHEFHLPLQLTVHFLGLLHELSIVVGVFLQEEDLNDIDEIFQNLVHNILEGEFSVAIEGLDEWLDSL